MYDLDLKPLLAEADSWRGRLMDTYADVPPTTCDRRTDCCANMPEIEAVELLNLYLTVSELGSEERARRLMRTVIYFFTNAAMIQPCPLLEGKDCLVYDRRPFSCRAYGLWSKSRHQKGVEASRRAKAQLSETWAGLGVKLPGEVTEFSPPYCDRVRVVEGGVDDSKLDDVQTRIHDLGEEVFDADNQFPLVYFNDFSFALSAKALGYQRCLQQKVLITKEMIKLDDSPTLRRLLPEAEKYVF